MYYFVYKTTNLVNGKIYIGKHCTSNLKDGYIGSGKRLSLAIKKYGRQNFKLEILHHCKSLDEMAEKEKEIVTPEFLKRKDVYNLHEGGKGGFHHIRASKKLSEKRRKAALKALPKQLSSYSKFVAEQKAKNTDWYKAFVERQRTKSKKANEVRWSK